jgi:hypothetical protein
VDFDEAVFSHTEWKRKLRQYIDKNDGSLRPAEVSLDHKCAPGEWICGEGASYSSLPEYNRLKYEHARFHQAASEIVSRANAGEDVAPEVEVCANSEFSQASSAIIIALVSMKKRVS